VLKHIERSGRLVVPTPTKPVVKTLPVIAASPFTCNLPLGAFVPMRMLPSVVTSIAFRTVSLNDERPTVRRAQKVNGGIRTYPNFADSGSKTGIFDGLLIVSA
jgi:hypothetical protein